MSSFFRLAPEALLLVSQPQHRAWAHNALLIAKAPLARKLCEFQTQNARSGNQPQLALPWALEVF